ncbi:MAG: cytochrome c oxidase accessory protein CcoG [Planctomycetes bacterium]|nr:cytochrome c oxidase accessory protein CcoG [Planctomycetota bacterium]
MSTLPSGPEDFRSVLASVQQDGQRKWVGARILWGRWRAWRMALAVPLTAFYCAIPFVSVGGKPALQFDLAARKFYVAGVAFWPQDLSYFVILVLLGIVGTLLTVALLGRVFCGWFCPHNVFLEMVFRPVEHLVLGGPGSPQKTPFWRAALMWLVFAVIAGGLANAGTAIFVGADAFRHHLILDWAGHPYAAVCWVVFFGIILFNFGWFREQTCTIVCPYGRFQTAMLDPHTLTVAYDARRGEPRGHLQHAPAPDEPKLGDCVDCGMCVRVCPTAIDIRNGNQLECIHCAACVDACDMVMGKLGRPKGLVRYAAEVQLAGQKRAIVRPRTILYTVVCCVLVALLVWRLQGRSEVLVAPLRQTAIPVREADPDGRDCVRAALPLSLVSRSDTALRARIVLGDAVQAKIILPQPVVELPPGQRVLATPIVYIPRTMFSGRHLDVDVRILAEDGRLLGSTEVGIRTP